MSENAKFGFSGEQSPRESEPLVGTRQPSMLPNMMRSRGKLIVALLIGLAVILAIALVVGISVGASNQSVASDQLDQSIKIENLMAHMQGLENIAIENSNSRAVMYGYNQSADMVYDKLVAAGYTNISKQYFVMASYEDNGGHSFTAEVPTGGTTYTFTFVLNNDYRVLRYSAAASQLAVKLDIVEACEPAEFTPGEVVLVEYGTCGSIFELAQFAKQQGAAGLIVSRTEGDPFRDSPLNSRVFRQTAEEFEVVDLPMIGVSYQTGQILKDFASIFSVDGDEVTVTLTLNMEVNFHNTYNVLAYTEGGFDDNIIVFGSHLDSVPAGPGINDNGSGSMANLEIALQLIGRGTEPINKVLFAFWGAEEWGLLGSYHFVKSLSTADRENIALNLNFDMIGSPNYIRQVYNGSGAENEQVLEASTAIQKLFEQRFQEIGLAYKLAPFTGRSDYGPFIEEGVDIPAGGLATGADETKTDVTRREFGGLAGAILDPCYHQYCDTVENVDQEVYEQMSQTAAHVLNVLMMKEDLKSFLNPSDFKDFL